MPGATYEFKMDFDRDGTFDGILDDLSGYVISANWNEGMSAPYQAVAPAARLSVQLYNQNGEFTGEALGPNEVANGGFDNWTGNVPDGWTVFGDPANGQVRQSNANGVAGTGYCKINNPTGNNDLYIQQACLQPGLLYKLTVAVTQLSQSLSLSFPFFPMGIFNGATEILPRIHTEGLYSFIFIASATTLSLGMYQSPNTTILDYVTCYPITYQPLMKLGTLCRLRATYNGTTTTFFTGRLVRKTPSVGRVGNRILTLEFEDPTNDMSVGDYKPKLLEDVTVDAAIAPVFDEAKVAYPYSHAYWMLGIPGCSELGETTYIFSPASTSFDTCYTTLDFVGDISDTTGTGIQQLMFIQQMMDAECGGRFFFNPRTGAFTIHSRNRDTLNDTIAATLTDADFEASNSAMVDGDDLENQTTINYQPRAVGAANTVIWEAQGVPIQVGVQQEYKTTASFLELSLGNNRMAAKDVQQAAYGVDIVGNLESDGSGADAFNRLTYSCEINANTAEWTIKNAHGDYPVYLTTLQLRGTPITFYDPKSAVALNGDSIRENHLAQNSVSVPAISDDETAQSYADYRVAKFGTPSQHFSQIGFVANNSAARMTNMMTLTVGSRISVIDSWTGHDADYIVVGATHQMSKGGENQHTVTLTVKPVSRETFWVLGVTGKSELGVTTRPGF